MITSLHFALDDMSLNRSGPQWIWIKMVPSKVKIFTWRAALDKLPTTVNPVNKVITLDSNLCPLCNSYPETLNHLLMDCSKAVEVRNIWRLRIVKATVKQAYFWLLWKKRNVVLFNNSKFNSHLVANDIQSATFFWFHRRCSVDFKVVYPIRLIVVVTRSQDQKLRPCFLRIKQDQYRTSFVLGQTAFPGLVLTLPGQTGSGFFDRVDQAFTGLSFSWTGSCANLVMAFYMYHEASTTCKVAGPGGSK
ncbi:hypothetical protein OSB04_014317 [Centaurea solstitialis]|uniref:Reverse transcriptase zinc-binding domain-containing protein n=1 Tax=Centaurea solstitialis TaxID=347529 RepID=A0AA38TF68_9ASTR|nr:hypothetical protein OSB04_014317 [Centaurea solstitialis]